MSNRDRGGDKDWVPIVAGVALGIGVLALLYKLMSGGGHCGQSGPDKVCKQTQRPYKCTCDKNDPVSPYIRSQAVEADPEGVLVHLTKKI